MVKTFHGGEKEAGDYSIHIQCDWKITRCCKTNDSFIDGLNVNVQPLLLKKDYINNLVADPIAKFADILGSKIELISADEYGGAKIQFDKGCTLEIVPEDLLSDELWRFFIPSNSDTHFVVFKHGIEFH